MPYGTTSSATGAPVRFKRELTVAITFRVKCDPDENQIAKLAMLIGNEIEFTMTPPKDGEIE